MYRDGNGKAPEGRTPQFLGKDDAAQGIHIATAIFLRVANAEKSEFTHFAQHLAGHKTLGLPGLGVGYDFLLHEATDLLAQHVLFFGKKRMLNRHAGPHSGWVGEEPLSAMGSSSTSSAPLSMLSSTAQ